ncbi:filamentous hemagglutinin N-terminal domain-containing protein, partial [Dapis sp. BLCC M229]|uniref:two-partner secretion domain-containing protein n=1 Tax=Dapis sp. BLCC M229 TaxID=3400188 RepID=UPI003CEA3A1A
VYFINPAGIENILTRITGNNASNILGKLGVDGAANLFLINPNGIFFGSNASLDIRGSFIATTADEIRLGENGLFSATNPQNNNLLSVAPSALFFNQIATQTGNIINQATETGLQVPTRETLGLIGKNVVIDGGKLTTKQGRVEIGSVGANSLIKLENTKNNYVLNYLEVENLNNIEVKNNAVVDVSGEGSGEIQIQGKKIQIKEKSRIIANTLGTQLGGNISLTASESIEVNDSLVNADVEIGATVNGANITTNSPGLTLANGGQIKTATFGEGQGGSIEINAVDVEVTNSFISADSNNNNDIARTTGKGGNLTIKTQRLTLKNGGRLLAVTSGASQGGNIMVNAREIKASGISPDGNFASGIDSRVQLGATGKGGNLTINTERLIQTDGAAIQAGVFSSGQGGEITVNAREIELSGNGISENLFPELSSVFESQNPEVPTSLFTTVFPGATGKGGNLTVNTQSMTLRDGALISTGTFGSGNSGDLTVIATEINLIGVRPISQIASGLFTSVSLPEATGNGGNLTVNTQNLTLRGGGTITTGTFGSGNSGDLTLTATEINLIGTNSNGQIPTGLFTTVFFGATGNGGDLTVDTESLRLIKGAQIGAGTSGVGQSGDVTINATDSIVLSEVSDFTGDSSAITVSSSDSGEAGSLNITAPSIQLNNGTLSAETTAGNQGNITIRASEINLTNNSEITTNATNSATGGDISIDTKFIIAFDNSNISANALEGKGGSIAIAAEGVFLDNSSQITATSALGIDGSVDLNTQVDPTQGVVKLSATVINAESLVAQNLCVATSEQKQGSSFVITGKGGLPPNPTQPLTVLRGTVGWESNTQEDTKVVMSESQQSVMVYRRPKNQNLPKITQAMGWVMTQSGKVTLTSTANRINSASPQLIHPSCYLFLGSRE